jgi:rhodanese-related sulfurtransferase
METESLHGATFEQWGPKELYDAYQRGEVAIIDVRTPQEYAFEHIKGALLAPMSSFDASKLPAQQGKQLVFHCGSGVRSRRVSEACIKTGFERIAHLEGGFAAWKQAGLPYVTIDPASGNQQEIGGQQT